MGRVDIGVSRAHREHVAVWWQEVFGGPARYTATLGGYPAMLDKHRNLGINAERRRRFVAHAPVPLGGWGEAPP